MSHPALATLLASLPGPTLPGEVATWLEEGLAGVVLFARNAPDPETLRRLCRSIRDIRPDALIALDEEGGEVTRLEAGTGSSWPGARALGVLDDPTTTATVAGALAAALAAAGANVNLAPVADVAVAGGNPVIGNRAFGDDPDLVGRHVGAWIEGSQTAGVAACAKHLPGHGAASTDSHLGLPVVDLDEAALRRVHLAPFARAVDAGAAALMTAHVVYPALDPVPATLSRRVLTGLVREELAFDGVVVTDSLTMGAIAEGTGVVAGAVGALRAGADLLCLNAGLDLLAAVVDGVAGALRAGELDRGRVEEAGERVARMASDYRPARHAPVVGRSEEADRRLGLEIARRAVGAGPLPPPLAGAPLVIEVRRSLTGVDDVRSRLLDALRQRSAATAGRVVGLDDLPSAEEVVALAGGAPLVLAVRDAWASPAQASLLSDVLDRRPDAVVVGLGSARDAELAPGRFVPAHGSAPPNLTAVAEAILPVAAAP